MRQFFCMCCLALSLVGCQTFTNPPLAINSIAAETVADKLQATINLSLSGVLALAKTVRSDYDARLVTIDEANAELAQLRVAKQQLDVAQALLDGNNTEAASTAAAMATRALNALRVKIEARTKRKESGHVS